MIRHVWLPVLLAVSILALACSGGDDEPEPTATTLPATSTSIPEGSPTVAPTATQPPPPLPSPPGPGRAVPKTVWLVDVAAGTAQTLAEDYASFAVSARFSPAGDEVHLAVNQELTAYDLDGNAIGPSSDLGDCTFTEQAEQVNGRWHPSLQCDSLPEGRHPFLSPDGRWFAYRLGDAAATPVFPPISEMWALNLETGERHLLHEMQDCGGCDGRFGPSWSPSGRYYVFAETGGDGRVFLSDLEAKMTRHIANGNQVGDRPQWAPEDDILIYRSPNAFTVVESMATGALDELDSLAWPAAFDASGQFLYSPAFGLSLKEPMSATTTIVPLSTFDVSSQLDGAPEWLNMWRDMVPIVGDPTLTAALVAASGCDGIQVYSRGVAVTCVEAGTGATISPSGESVAMSRVTGTTGQVSFPGGSFVSMNVFEIVIVDVATGALTVVAEDAISDQAPSILWNDDSSHLLVEWPVFGGL